MAEGERLPDDAVVVRCGLPPFRDSPLNRGCRHHPDGFFGFSVQASVGMTVEQLATACFNKSVGFTTVVVPEDWGADAAEELARIFEQAANPTPKKRQRS